MTFALEAMDPTVQGIFFLVAVVLFLVAAWLVRDAVPAALTSLGLAFFAFVFCWNAFAAS